MEIKTSFFGTVYLVCLILIILIASTGFCQSPELTAWKSPDHGLKNYKIKYEATFISSVYHNDCISNCSIIYHGDLSICAIRHLTDVCWFCSVVCISPMYLPPHSSRKRICRRCISMKTSIWHWCTFVVVYANWPGWRRSLFDVQIMILGALQICTPLHFC